MKIAVIHGSNQGFFPRFYKALHYAITESGSECKLFSNKSGMNKRNVLPNQVFWGNRFNWFIHFKLYKFLGIQDIFSIFPTLSLINKLKKYQPDVIHFNVVNEWIINFPLLINYINKNNIPVVWTMHDCRAFTGRCAYFDEIGCDRWKSGCGCCPEKKLYWPTTIENSAWQWKFRAKWFNEIKNLHIVTPSQWLADFVNQSFFRKKNIRVIYNGVDTEVFSSKSSYDIFSNYQISRLKKIVLGCAINWEPRKGLSYFKDLITKLPENFQVVLIGGISSEDKAILESKGAICPGRTSTFEEMLAWYQEASVFVNPTLADNFPTTNIEALASGTPVITFRTGGSPEAVDESTGYVVEQRNLIALVDAIIECCKRNRTEMRQLCLGRSSLFSLKQYAKYVSLYREINNERV